MLVQVRDHSLTRDSWHRQVSEARKEKDVTQHELARVTGIHQSRISQIENGEVDPKLSEVTAMAQALELGVVVSPVRFLDSVNFTILDALAIEEERNGPLTKIEKIVGRRTA